MSIVADAEILNGNHSSEGQHAILKFFDTSLSDGILKVITEVSVDLVVYNASCITKHEHHAPFQVKARRSLPFERMLNWTCCCGRGRRLNTSIRGRFLRSMTETRI